MTAWCLTTGVSRFTGGNPARYFKALNLDTLILDFQEPGLKSYRKKKKKKKRLISVFNLSIKADAFPGSITPFIRLTVLHPFFLKKKKD